MSSTVEEGERKTRKDSSEGRREEEKTRDARVRYFPAVMRDDVCQTIITLTSNCALCRTSGR